MKGVLSCSFVAIVGLGVGVFRVFASIAIFAYSCAF